MSMASLQMVITPIQHCVAVYTASDNSWQLPNGAITIITQELAKHESSFADGFFLGKNMVGSGLPPVSGGFVINEHAKRR